MADNSIVVSRKPYSKPLLDMVHQQADVIGAPLPFGGNISTFSTITTTGNVSCTTTTIPRWYNSTLTNTPLHSVFSGNSTSPAGVSPPASSSIWLSTGLGTGPAGPSSTASPDTSATSPTSSNALGSVGTLSLWSAPASSGAAATSYEIFDHH